MTYKITYNNSTPTETVDADDHHQEGKDGELTVFTKTRTDGLATTTDKVLTVRTQAVSRIEKV